MRMPSLAGLALATLCLAGAPATAAAADGNWSFSVGAHLVQPDEDNGELLNGTLSTDVSGSWRPTVTAEYFFSPNWGIEVLASLPFEHDIELNGVHAASVSQLPPTASLQYHFGSGRVRPFVGAGLNWTIFFDEESEGPLAGTDLSLDDSVGLAAHFGVDIEAGKGAIRLDARWIDIDTDVSVNDVDVGSASIDPWVFGAAYVWKF